MPKILKLLVIGLFLIFIIYAFIPFANSSHIPKILAIGDSITGGYTRMYTSNIHPVHPYTLKLKEILKNSFPMYDLVLASFHCVDSVTMPPFFEKTINSADYSISIIWLGANDIANYYGKRSTDYIANRIIMMHRIALRKNMKTIVILLPETQENTEYTDENKSRNEINEKLIRFANKYKNVYLCDLTEFFAWSTSTNEMRSKISDGGIHYTPLGYDLIAQYIYDTALINAIKADLENNQSIIHNKEFEPTPGDIIDTSACGTVTYAPDSWPDIDDPLPDKN